MSVARRGTREVHTLLAPLLEEAEGERGPGLRRVASDLGSLYLKYGPLRGSAALRYGLRARLGLPAPRLREFDNLAWLRDAGFLAPEPLAAGVRVTSLRASFQFLATRELPGRITLRAFLARGDEASLARRPAGLAELGARVARLHRAGFVHRDLFPRNLLVEESGGESVAFLDTWRGGPRRQPPGRGIAYDLACLLLYLPDLVTGDEEALLLEHYAREAGLLGRPRGKARWERLLGSARRTRARLLSALRRRGRTSPLPPH